LKNTVQECKKCDDNKYPKRSFYRLFVPGKEICQGKKQERVLDNSQKTPEAFVEMCASQ
jgi:hypothetical protein